MTTPSPTTATRLPTSAGEVPLAITYAFAPVAAPSAAVDFEAAPAALSAQYARASAATREILLFGAMLLAVKRALPTHVFDTATTPSLKSWLAENCPEIPYNTARAYMNLAAGLVATLELATVQDALPALLSAPEGTLPDALAGERQRIDEALSGKSARQLEFDFGIRSAAPKTHGGARAGAGRPSKSLLDEQVKIDSFFGDDVLSRWTDAILIHRWHLRATPKAKEALLAIAGEITSSLGGARPGKTKAK